MRFSPRGQRCRLSFPAELRHEHHPADVSIRCPRHVAVLTSDLHEVEHHLLPLSSAPEVQFIQKKNKKNLPFELSPPRLHLGFAAEDVHCEQAIVS